MSRRRRAKRDSRTPRTAAARERERGRERIRMRNRKGKRKRERERERGREREREREKEKEKQKEKEKKEEEEKEKQKEGRERVSLVSLACLAMLAQEPALGRAIAHAEASDAGRMDLGEKAQEHCSLELCGNLAHSRLGVTPTLLAW